MVNDQKFLIKVINNHFIQIKMVNNHFIQFENGQQSLYSKQEWSMIKII
jgi:hypothetical protein